MTRVGDVKPLMEVACYTCDACGFEIYQEVTGDTFMPIQRCPTGACLNNSAGAMLHLQTRACKARREAPAYAMRAFIVTLHSRHLTHHVFRSS